jgi:hypothetical protein
MLSGLPHITNSCVVAKIIKLESRVWQRPQGRTILVAFDATLVCYFITYLELKSASLDVRLSFSL